MFDLLRPEPVDCDVPAGTVDVVEEPMNPGIRIKHPEWGFGWVTHVQEETVWILFDHAPSEPNSLIGQRQWIDTRDGWLKNGVALIGTNHYVWHDDQIWQVRFNEGFELWRDDQCIEDVSLASYRTAKRDGIAEGDWVRIDDAVHLMCGSLTSGTRGSEEIFEVQTPVTQNVYGRDEMVLAEACTKVMDARLARALKEIV